MPQILSKSGQVIGRSTVSYINTKNTNIELLVNGQWCSFVKYENETIKQAASRYQQNYTWLICSKPSNITPGEFLGAFINTINNISENNEIINIKSLYLTRTNLNKIIETIHQAVKDCHHDNHHLIDTLESVKDTIQNEVNKIQKQIDYHIPICKNNH